MQNCSKSKCMSSAHQRLMNNAKNRLNNLQDRFTDLQAARKEGRTGDVAVLEEQVYRSLSEWKAELDVPSPASSLIGGSLGSFSDDIARLLLLCEEEDDAISPLVEPAVLKPEPDIQSLYPGNLMAVPEGGNLGSFSDDISGLLQLCEEEDNAISPLVEPTALKTEPDIRSLHPGNLTAGPEDYLVNSEPKEYGFQGFDQCKGPVSCVHNTVVSNSNLSTLLDYQQLNLHQEFSHGLPFDANGTEECGSDAGPNILPNISPPPYAFMGPICALWDCTRPAQGSEWYQDYCSSFHARLALNENAPGMTPVLRPGGIGLKDNLLFDALSATTQGKNVGIPQCEGAASAKSPWNASELFDISLLNGETIREWLFFDKPRRAFESGNRKQRSLPDYSGRGWHESRKQVMKEFEGQKRSYYMDPQPSSGLEWHLYEYEINSCDACALYRLELKLVSEKKSPKGKVMKDSLADLQKKMGRLTAEVSADNRPC